MYVAIDVGGTKTLVALLTPEGEIKQQVKFATPNDYLELLSALEAQVKQLGEQQYQAAAVGAPGIIDRSTGVVLSYGHRDWQNTPVAQDFSKILGCPVYLENDGKLGGLAEAILIKDEYKNVLYLAIGTGIGVAYTANGIIDTNISDGGGHTMLLQHDGKTQPWEDFAGGKAIVEQYGKKAADITDPAAWISIAHHLSLGIVELLKTLKPDVIIFGGGVGAHFQHFDSFLEEDLKHQLGEQQIPPFRQAQHAEEAVIYGCYELIKQAQDGKTTS